MSDKSEAVTIRMTPEMRKNLNEWKDENGYSSEADALRGLIRDRTMMDKQLEEFHDKGSEEIIEKLDRIEEEIKKANKPLWKRIYR